ncbi:DUF3006 domain-containing protein [Peribacillus deserti]|uniref:DUF3006 domain-containing protein n=1 Tax=Peribacillus deserti TaxID=673318 RepID=A0A2N5M4J1_9BACI|nr:DUF3006 domain-containing protein [Peribacillus deserti]PLT29288.1 DUF3006 domain-containing protein [Peribacillus deserti]
MSERTKGIIDRFEGNVVVVEINGDTKDFPKDMFPTEAAVGDVIEIMGEQVKVLKGETQELRKQIEDLMGELWED